MKMRPLNIFQRCMRIWEESHPYNALQIMELAAGAEGELTLDRIRAAWNAAVAAAGLGEAKVRGGKFCYEPAMPQEVMEVEGEGEAALEGLITREINRPFGGGRRGDGTTVPFRAFVVRGGGKSGDLRSQGSLYVGVVYQHWVADSVAMRMLMREWFCRLYHPSASAAKPLQMPEGGFWRYFGPGRGGWHLGEGVAGLLESMAQFGGARRLEEDGGGPGAQRVECSVHRLAEGIVEGLLGAARRRKMTLNDLFLAALARACDEHGAAPRRSSRDLALGTIVDLRATSTENLENTFGMFLGYTGLVVRAEHLQDRDRLLMSIAAKNAQQKESRAAQASVLRMAAGYMQGRFLSAERLAAFYREYMPLMGGVSNVNMNRSWAAAYHPSRLVDYIRVAPTGPMVPVVIAMTTMGKRLTFVLTRRASLVNAERGAALARRFADELTALANMG